jgi:NAD(P)-dependent dehydrogenase (short-subunit alcohol dehydrogenase family)
MGRKLENKVALITGAGGGMGGACAAAYAGEGAGVVCVDLNREPLAQTADSITAGGGKVLALEADVCDQAAVEHAVQEALKEFDRIDILVNCAGHQGPGAPVWEVDPDGWQLTIDVNLRGTFLFCRYVLPQMVSRKAGKIINVASGAGIHTMPFFSGYAASKAAVIHFTRTIAEELTPYGINANALGVRGVTKMWRDVLEAGPGGGTTTKSIREQVNAGMDPKVEENMAVFLFLASEASDHVTGQYLEANSLPGYAVTERE